MSHVHDGVHAELPHRLEQERAQVAGTPEIHLLPHQPPFARGLGARRPVAADRHHQLHRWLGGEVPRDGQT